MKDLPRSQAIERLPGHVERRAQVEMEGSAQSEGQGGHPLQQMPGFGEAFAKGLLVNVHDNYDIHEHRQLQRLQREFQVKLMGPRGQALQLKLGARFTTIIEAVGDGSEAGLRPELCTEQQAWTEGGTEAATSRAFPGPEHSASVICSRAPCLGANGEFSSGSIRFGGGSSVA